MDAGRDTAVGADDDVGEGEGEREEERERRCRPTPAPVSMAAVRVVEGSSVRWRGATSEIPSDSASRLSCSRSASITI